MVNITPIKETFLEDKIPYAALVAIAVFGLSKIIEIGVFWWKSRKEREKFIRALYAEIDFNTRDMELFVSTSDSLAAVNQKIRESADYVPHITNSVHIDIYKSQINLIHYAGNDYIGDVVAFYGLMQRISVEVASAYLPSFKLISVESRVSVIDDLLQYAMACSHLGNSILQTMEDNYPSYCLRRKTRKAPDNISDAELQKRREQFNLDFNRTWSTHLKTPHRETT